MTAARMPTFFFAHGAGPCFFMEGGPFGPKGTWDLMEASLRGLTRMLPRTPKAIVAISAHWEEPVVTVNTGAAPELYFDYYGFPEHTYRLEYPAPGEPALAERVLDLLKGAGIPAATDAARGFDHGVFIPFLLIRPQADIPIVQVSLKAGLDPAAHLALGRALAPLRDEDVLIVGSGQSWHSGRLADREAAAGWARQFDQWLTHALSDADHREAALIQWETAPYARIAHGREEHLAPLFVVAGAAAGEPAHRYYSEALRGQITVSSFAFGDIVSPDAWRRQPETAQA